jgi:hypothetical protein
MRAPDPAPNSQAQRAGQRRMLAKYRREYGALEFCRLAAFTRFSYSAFDSAGY